MEKKRSVLSINTLKQLARSNNMCTPLLALIFSAKNLNPFCTESSVHWRCRPTAPSHRRSNDYVASCVRLQASENTQARSFTHTHTHTNTHKERETPLTFTTASKQFVSFHFFCTRKVSIQRWTSLASACPAYGECEEGLFIFRSNIECTSMRASHHRILSKIERDEGAVDAAYMPLH